MPTNHAAVAALPIGSSAASKTLVRNILVARMPYVLANAETAQDLVAVDPSTGAVIVDILFLGRVFHYDATDTTTAHDGTSCLVSSDGKRYKLASGTDVFAYAVINVTTTTPPGAPTIGDAYLVAAGGTGAWAGHDNKIAYYGARGWEFVEFGSGRLLYDKLTDSYYHKSAAGAWVLGFGLQTLAADGVPLSAIVGQDASLVIKVENQTTEVPPGSRVSGGTPTVPLGGTAANINDNNVSTLSVTSALGNLAGASVAARIIAKIDLGSSKTIKAIEALGYKCSTGSSSLTDCGLYYSTDNIAWTALGALFNITTTATDFRRTGTVTGRYVAVVTSAKDWSSATNTINGLNAYDTTVVAAVGTAYIIGANPIGVWASNALKVAIADVANSFSIYTPAAGDEVYDKALNRRVKWTGAAWITAAGAWLHQESIFTATGSTTASGTVASSYSSATAPINTTRRLIDNATITYAASVIGTRNLRITWAGDITHSHVATRSFIALFRDSETDAIAWQIGSWGDPTIDSTASATYINYVFYVSAADIASHVYTVMFMNSATGGVSVANRRTMTLEEAG